MSAGRYQLDAARFEDAFAAATRATGKVALRILDQALSLWRGPALAEFADRPFAQPEAVRLDDQLIEHLASRQQLLMLDNCEHAADTVAVIAERLLRETRNVTVLATSRERLGVDGEHIWLVKPLPTEGPGAPAVRLFLDRACAADPAARHGPPDGPAPGHPDCHRIPCLHRTRRAPR